MRSLVECHRAKRSAVDELGVLAVRQGLQSVIQLGLVVS